METSTELLIDRIKDSQIIDSINLSNRNLNEFPQTLKNFLQLKYLYLDNNKLIFAPEIGNFHSLEELTMEDNGLTLIPETYFNLKNLKLLNFSKNPLRCINDSLFSNFNKLTSLWLNECELMFLPKEIGSLTFLEKLGLRSNLLQDLPEEFGQLVNLKWLCLEKNELQSLPDTFRNLKLIAFLNLSFNKLEDIPEFIFDMSSLNILLLQNNSIRAFKDEHVLGLAFLHKLDMRSNVCIKRVKANQPEFYKQLLSIKSFVVEEENK
jgi:Leucine-rich repeat (LRR) protein